MIVKDARGNEFLEFIPATYINESEAELVYENITHSLVVVKIGNEYLMGWNHWRKNWEIFGGCRDKEEVEKLTFYSQIKEKDSIAAIDEALLKYWN